MDQPTKHTRQDYSIITGIVIIIIGTIFLLENFNVIEIGERWWALFFLIPISFMVSDIWRRRQNNQGKIPVTARGSFIGLIVLSVVMFTFLLELDWAVIWPVFIIIGGLSLILSHSWKWYALIFPQIKIATNKSPWQSKNNRDVLAFDTISTQPFF